MKILFTGDVNFRGQVNLTYERSKEILSQVQPFIDRADYVVPNLECPLADEGQYAPIKKSGPNLICAPENICFLKAMQADAVTLANNHIGDFGDGALRDTLRLLDAKTIAHAGAGENLDEAYGAFYLEKDGMRVAVLSVCEHEFGLATANRPGSAAYDPRRLLARIREEKAGGSCVIVVFHGGNEFNPLPSPDTVERYRLICDMGADAVIAGHTHCPQGYELYQGKPIIYSMGNFFFKSSTPRDEHNSWHYGYMTMLDISENRLSVEVIPCRFDVNATQVTVFDGEARTAMLGYIEKLSGIIADEQALKSHFMGWAWNHPWCPVLPKDAREPAECNVSGNYNLIRCEAHLSQLTALLEMLHFEKVDEAERMSREIHELERMPV